MLLRSERLDSERHGYKLKRSFLYIPASTICEVLLTEKQLEEEGGKEERRNAPRREKLLI